MGKTTQVFYSCDVTGKVTDEEIEIDDDTRLPGEGFALITVQWLRPNIELQEARALRIAAIDQQVEGAVQQQLANASVQKIEITDAQIEEGRAAIRQQVEMVVPAIDGEDQIIEERIIVLCPEALQTWLKSIGRDTE